MNSFVKKNSLKLLLKKTVFRSLLLQTHFNNSRKRVIIGALALCFFTAGFLFSEIDSSNIANRQTAIRVLDQCKIFFAQSKFQEAFDWSKIGIQYDSNIPDLWYMCALAASALNQPKVDIIEYVSAALEGTHWLQYNRNAARLLFADLLCDTCEPKRALSVLNENPALDTAEAEYIRAKSYYRLNEKENARKQIRTALAMFPQEVRFALLFYKNERLAKSDANGLLLAEALNNMLPLWENSNPEVTLFAAPFIPFAQERNRMVQAFNARGLKNQLYLVLALNYGLISEEEAFNYVNSLLKTEPLDFALFKEFVSYIQTNQMREKLQNWLTAFEGTIIFDTNKDGIFDLFADYTRGRTSVIRYQKKQDGIDTWISHCDFGAPISVTTENKQIIYSVYPTVNTVVINAPTGAEVYSLRANAFSWSPFVLAKAQLSPLTSDFFIPVPNKILEYSPVSDGDITQQTLLAFAANISVTTQERTDSQARFTMLNGKPVSATYTSKNQPFAYATFENGIPKFRNIDSNGDGFYDITETFAFSVRDSMLYQTQEQKITLYNDIFGTLSAGNGLYISKISADINKDRFIDYEKTILPYEGFSSVWKNTDGIEQIRYTKQAQIQNGIFSGNYLEETFFINPANGEKITVTFQNGIPNSVQTSRGKKSIAKDPIYNIYWIGTTGDMQTAQKIMSSFNLLGSSGVSIILNGENNSRILAVSLGNVYFGEIFNE